MLTRRKPHFPRHFPNWTISYSPGTLNISWTFESPDIFIFYSVIQTTKGLVKPLASGFSGSVTADLRWFASSEPEVQRTSEKAFLMMPAPPRIILVHYPKVNCLWNLAMPATLLDVGCAM